MPIVPSGNADFTPTRGNYKDLKPFRFWCQKVLPAVYDDSLSYYELLTKVVDYLNMTMEDVETSIEDIDNIRTAYTELQDYVNDTLDDYAETYNDFEGRVTTTTENLMNAFATLQGFINDYFENLDVQEEIDNKLDEMVLDGTLDDLIEPIVENILNSNVPVAVGAWLEQYVDPTTMPMVDYSLKISGAAGDSETTGESFNADRVKMDILHNTVNYGYDVQELDIDDESADVAKKVGVKRLGSEFIVNGTSDSAVVTRIKLNGTLDRDSTNNYLVNWDDGLTLVEEHKYKASLILVDGEVNYGGVAVYKPRLDVDEIGSGTSIGDNPVYDGLSCTREFTAGSTNVNLVLWISNGTEFDGAKYQLLVQDMTVTEAFLDEIVADALEVVTGLTEDAEAAADRAESAVSNAEDAAQDAIDAAQSVDADEIWEAVDDLNSAFGCLGVTFEDIDVSSYDTVYGTIQGNNTWAAINIGSYFTTALITDIPNVIKVKAQSTHKAYVSFLTRVVQQPVSTTETIPFCSGETGRRTVNEDTEETYTVPTDCNCIAVSVLMNDVDYTPTIKGIFAEKTIDEIQDDIEGLQDKTSPLINVENYNLFNPLESVDGYLKTDGTIEVYQDWKTTGYIYVHGMSSIAVSSMANATSRQFNPVYYLHAYGASKNHLRKIADSSTNGKCEIANDIYYIRFSYHNYSGWNIELQVEEGTVFKPYIPYKEYNALKDSLYENRDFLTTKDINIVCWGDSLTYSQYANEVTYPKALSELIEEENVVQNFGIPGETSVAIASRQGAYPIYVEPFTLPTSSGVTVTIKNVYGEDFYTLLHNSPRDDNPISFVGTGTIEDYENISLGYSSGEYRIGVIGTGNTGKTFDRPTILSFYGDWFRNFIPIIWAGTNDGPTTGEDADNIVSTIKAMVEYSKEKRFLVLGLTHKPYADLVNNKLAKTFGKYYVDVKKYLIEYGLTDNSITPTAQDETDISNDVIPTSLRYDTIHFNDYGYSSIAKCVYLHGKALQFWH